MQPFTKKQTQELARIDGQKTSGSGPGKVTIAALCDNAYEGAYDDNKWPGCLDNPEHLDAWQRGIFPS